MLRVVTGLFFLTAFMSISVRHVSADTFNRVVAIVNEDVITLHELNTVMQEMTGLSPDNLKFRNNDAYLDTRRKVLELLINEKITQAKILELGINVPSTEIDATIERIKKDNRLTQEDLILKLKGGGLTYKKYREKIKKDIERARLINFEVKSKIIIREERLRAYYVKHKEKFSIDGHVHLAIIFLKNNDTKNDAAGRKLSGKGEEILARITRGEDFAALARKYSQGPGAKEGGDLGNFKIAQLDPELRRLIEGLSEGGISNLIFRNNGIQIIKLIKKKEGTVQPFEEVRDAIFSTLYGDEVDKRYSSWIEKLRQRSYTKIIF